MPEYINTSGRCIDCPTRINPGSKLLNSLNGEKAHKAKGRPVGFEAEGKPVLDLSTGVRYRAAAVAGRSLGIAPATIAQCCRGETKAAKGHVLRFLDDLGKPIEPAYTGGVYRGRMVRNLRTGHLYGNVALACRLLGLTEWEVKCLAEHGESLKWED